MSAATIVPKVYVGDVGTIILIDLQEVISAATDLSFQVKKPDKSVVVWTPSIDGTMKLKYTILSGDLNVVGKYVIQPKLTLGGWVGRGNSVELIVYPLFE